jgi:hypothetical protein
MYYPTFGFYFSPGWGCWFWPGSMCWTWPRLGFYYYPSFGYSVYTPVVVAPAASSDEVAPPVSRARTQVAQDISRPYEIFVENEKNTPLYFAIYERMAAGVLEGGNYLQRIEKEPRILSKKQVIKVILTDRGEGVDYVVLASRTLDDLAPVVKQDKDGKTSRVDLSHEKYEDGKSGVKVSITASLSKSEKKRLNQLKSQAKGRDKVGVVSDRLANATEEELKEGRQAEDGKPVSESSEQEKKGEERDTLAKESELGMAF